MHLDVNLQSRESKVSKDALRRKDVEKFKLYVFLYVNNVILIIYHSF